MAALTRVVNILSERQGRENCQKNDHIAAHLCFQPENIKGAWLLIATDGGTENVAYILKSGDAMPKLNVLDITLQRSFR
jgi:hypothetical protein